MTFFVLHIGSAMAILIAGGALLAFGKKTGFRNCFILGWFWQVVLSLPAGTWQTLVCRPNISPSGSSIWIHLITPLVVWPFNAGGFTVRFAYKATVGPLVWLVGHRTAMLLSNMPYYYFLLLIQGGIIAALFVWRYKKGGTYKDGFVICVAVMFLVNSFIKVTWLQIGS